MCHSEGKNKYSGQGFSSRGTQKLGEGSGSRMIAAIKIVTFGVLCVCVCIFIISTFKIKKTMVSSKVWPPCRVYFF